MAQQAEPQHPPRPTNATPIDYIELPAVNIAELKKFYEHVFDWKFVDYGEAYTSFSDGRLTGGIRQEPSVTPGGPLIVLYAKDLPAMQERITNSGGTIVRETFSFPGGSRFHFTDPAGNELAVWSDQ